MPAPSASLVTSGSCFLLSMPPELRLEIIDLVVTIRNGKGKVTIIKTADGLQLPMVINRVKGLLRTNKQLRDEAIKQLYSINEFKFVAKNVRAEDGIIKSLYLPKNAGLFTNIPITTNLASNIVCYSFSKWRPRPFYSRQRVAHGSMNDRIVIRAEGSAVRLMPLSFREHVVRLSLTLAVPLHTRKVKLQKPPFIEYLSEYTFPDRDWLLPVRNMKEIGFTKLHELSLEVQYSPSIGGNRDDGEQRLDKLRAWTNGQLEGMSANITSIIVEIIFLEVPSSCDWE